MTEDLKFYVGLHQPADAKHFGLACVSVNRVRGRKKPIECPDVLLDSGAFTELEKYGEYRHDEAEYAKELYRLHILGVMKIRAAVAQDYMCEPFMLAKTGLTVLEHQWLTVYRYDVLMYELVKLFNGPPPFHVLPVLQGFTPDEYANHITMYEGRLTFGMWVGVGSVCKRQGDPGAIIAVLRSIKSARPDLRLHGFGVKKTSLKNAEIRKGFYSADSMAWSYSARKQGRDGNDWQEAKRFVEAIEEAA